jgi:2,3-dihydroxy-p-cumate/2,3-dihydroxybenzoate 3,4-dioxygenase
VAYARQAAITGFGHLCLDAPDVHEAYKFWSTRFNARVSDWLGDAACLMRIDPVHHKLAVFRGDGPGRHPQSTAIFVYFQGPENFTYEYSFGVRRIEDEASWVPRTFDPAEPGSIDMWLGPTSRPVTQPQVASGPPARIASVASLS